MRRFRSEQFFFFKTKFNFFWELFYRIKKIVLFKIFSNQVQLCSSIKSINSDTRTIKWDTSFYRVKYIGYKSPKIIIHLPPEWHFWPIIKKSRIMEFNFIKSDKIISMLNLTFCARQKGYYLIFENFSKSINFWFIFFFLGYKEGWARACPSPSPSPTRDPKKLFGDSSGNNTTKLIDLISLSMFKV